MLTEQIKLTLKDAAKKLTGSKKRAFMEQALYRMSSIDNLIPKISNSSIYWQGNCKGSSFT